MRDEAGPIERADLARSEALADQERRRSALGQEARRERKGEAHRRRPVQGLGRNDLVQGVVHQPAAERRIERTGEGDAPRGALAGGDRLLARLGLDFRNEAAQIRRLRPAGRQHKVQTQLFGFCSCFEPRRGESQGGASRRPD